MKNLIILFMLMIVFFSGCAKHPYLETVNKVELEKYKGTWYEIARFEHFFERGCKNVTATYTLEQERILITNRCQMIEDNEQKEAHGIAYAIDATNSKLKVSFFRPFYGDYWVIDLAPDYSWALVGNPNRKYLWILSRTKTISNALKTKILNKLPELGFNSKEFIWTIQE